MNPFRSWMAVLVALAVGVLVIVGAGCGSDSEDDTVTEAQTEVETEAAPEQQTEPAAGSDVTTTQDYNGKQYTETEQVAPANEQGDCPPGQVEQKDGQCLPFQPSG